MCPFLLYFILKVSKLLYRFHLKGRRGRDRMVIKFTTICAISAYHHSSYQFEPRSWRGVLDATLCDKVCQ
jgi:hypothetical protein